MKLVSVIMPYFKKEKYFEQSVNSVLSQSYKNFEVIIIDDELSLQSKNLLSKISQIDARIKIISNPTNLGAGLSRNNGIKFSNGEFIAFCDCDDLWKKNKLEEQIKFMNTSNLEFSFTSYEIINNKNEKIGLRKAEKNLSFKKLRNSCDIGLSTVIIKKISLIMKNLDLEKQRQKKILYFG